MNRIILLTLISYFTSTTFCSESLPRIEDPNTYKNTIAHHLTTKEKVWNFCSIICADDDIDDDEFALAVIGHEEEFVTQLVEAQINLNEWFGGEYGTLLSMAARWDNYALVKALLDKGADPNIQRDNTDNTLHLAIEHHAKVLKLLLERGANPAVKLAYPLLDHAVWQDNDDAVDLLLEHAAPIIANFEGTTPLGLAVKRMSNKIRVVKLLVEKGHANVNHQDKKGRTTVHYFAEKAVITEDDKEVLIFLVSKGACLDSKDNDGWTPLHVAAKNNNGDALEILIELGANLNITDNNGKMPLRIALENFKEKAIARLVKLGARTVDDTALSVAVRADEPLCVEALLPGLVPHQKKQINNALLWATALGRTAILSLLLKYGADIEYEENGRRPLYWAIEHQRSDCVRALCKAGATIDYSNATGTVISSPLHVACRIYGKASAEILLDHGANIELKDHERTPLMSAIEAGNYPATELLLSRGADVHALGHENLTPLHYWLLRVLKGPGEGISLRILLRAGASIVAEDIHGESPLSLSLRAGLVHWIKEELIQNCFWAYRPTRDIFLASSRRIFQVIRWLQKKDLPPYVIAHILLCDKDFKDDVIQMFLDQLCRKSISPTLPLVKKDKNPQGHMHQLSFIFDLLRLDAIAEYLHDQFEPHLMRVQTLFAARGGEQGTALRECLAKLMKDLKADLKDGVDRRYGELLEAARSQSPINTEQKAQIIALEEQQIGTVKKSRIEA